MNKSSTVAIIGAGKVGTSIGILAACAGYPVIVGGRRNEATVTAARLIGKDVCACDITEAAKSAQIALLCLPDDVIEEVCTELAKQNRFIETAIIAHCSGALPSSILSAARDYCKCSVASMYPMQTFPTVDAGIKTMRGTYYFYEGDENVIPVIEHFVRNIGLKPIRVTSISKTLCHAAATMACNYFTALIDSAIVLAENAGIDRITVWSALKLLVISTLDNITRMGTTDSLTGPIARGDVKTISRHLQDLVLMGEPLVSVYQTMGLYTVKMAIRKGTVTASKAAGIKDLLAGSDNSHT